MKFTDLTDEQQKFATRRDQHVLALASAGAGKTLGIIMFTNDKINYGVKPEELISFSFTKKAANEIKDRVNKFFKGKKYDFKYISTVHSFCWNELIKPFHKEIGYTSIPTITHDFPDEFMVKEFKSHGGKKEKGAFNKDFMIKISKDLQQEDFGEDGTIRLLQYLVEHNLVMFDFMIHLANFVLEEEEHIGPAKVSIGRIKYVIVDEAQDLNPAQFRFTKLLQSTFSTDGYETKIVMVGDFKQSIYGFRGSSPELINQFIEEFDPSIDIMTYNFRSAPEIVEFANTIADTIDLGNKSLDDSKISRPARTDVIGDVFHIYDEVEFLEELKNIQKPLHETCILARSNMTIKGIAKILGKLQIPYYLHTEYDILKRAEVKVFMNMLSLVSNGYNKAIILELIKTTKGGVPMKIARGINKCTSMKDINSMFSDVKKIPELVSIYSDLAKGQFQLGIPKVAKLLETPKKTAEQMKESLNRFHRDLNEIKVKEGLSSWMEALEELLFEAQFLEEKSAGKVQLMTVHKSKGLQWDNVIFIYDSTILDLVEHDWFDIEEEKRVVYTAVTRPKENLVYLDMRGEEIRDHFDRGSLEKKIDKGLKYNRLDLDDYRKY